MKFEISAQERKQARHPHEYFLVNLITNHILVFVGLLGLSLIHISEPTRQDTRSRMPSSA